MKLLSLLVVLHVRWTIRRLTDDLTGCHIGTLNVEMTHIERNKHYIITEIDYSRNQKTYHEINGTYNANVNQNALCINVMEGISQKSDRKYMI